MSDATNDEKLIDNLTVELYSSICFAAGGKPPVEKLRRLFMPGARMINNDGDEPTVMPVNDFIAAYGENIESGRIKSFEEKEIAAITEIFGKIAHRFSTYESRFDLNSDEPIAVGINSIQFVKIGGAWQISCMVWNNQNDDMTIPNRYLPEE